MDMELFQVFMEFSDLIQNILKGMKIIESGVGYVPMMKLVCMQGSFL